ncbi:SSI family serine proteinase inhibitor [Umezawaea sp. Da 62-37]|uniref:SSI family serine proteinase inhibitor n=1 Tax=Umezawaea sp. Da 62-37 TaxID=3075927 RepID=UPI0028F72540|nr:SSI family serine proteinase inhibitor [Umezawaea sp. Da 62-37]WNV90509.1 SSI family serine proteinase inhibitor [Umezawaea sp. Da 62-37]
MAPLPLLLAALLPFSTLPPPADLVPASAIVLSVTDGVNRVLRTVDLQCEPVGGTHPRAQAACDSLDRVDGHIGAQSDGNPICTLVYDPVRATATGTWHGQPRKFDQTFSNTCVMHGRTGDVFQF